MEQLGNIKMRSMIEMINNDQSHLSLRSDEQTHPSKNDRKMDWTTAVTRGRSVPIRCTPIAPAVKRDSYFHEDKKSAL